LRAEWDVELTGFPVLGQVWKRLVRFVAREDGQEYYGEPTCSASTDVGELFASS
jgi:hypothetical protein